MTEALRLRLAHIHLLALDVDGTLTDGGLFIGFEGEQLKRFHAHDGLGMVLAREVGLQIAWVTGRQNFITSTRAKELGITTVLQGVHDKGQAIQELAKTFGLDRDAIAFMGDDLNDLPAMARVGVALAPANAVGYVREAADWVATKDGGAGAVREAIEVILTARGDFDTAVRRYLEKLSPGQ